MTMGATACIGIITAIGRAYALNPFFVHYVPNHLTMGASNIIGRLPGSHRTDPAGERL